MKAHKKNERGVTSIEYSCLLAMICAVTIPIFVGDGVEDEGLGAALSAPFFHVAKHIKTANGGSEGTITIIGGSSAP